MSDSRTRDALIVGIDFGTTFSGVAWYYTISNDPSHIKIVDNWPGGQSANRTAGQIPSLLLYTDEHDRSKYKWGFQISPENQKRLSWLKLLLNRGSSTNFAGREELEERLEMTAAQIPEGKRVVDVVADYLRQLLTWTFEKSIGRTYDSSVTKQFGKTVPIHYVLSVPAVWTDAAKSLTLEAAKLAGMEGNDNINSSVRLISEPEAAAMHCLKFYHDDMKSCFKVGDIYVVADCGGGTVDMITYEISSISPKLRVDECVAGTGGMCGSTSLNRRFMAFVKQRLGAEDWGKLNLHEKLKLEEEFETQKKNFDFELLENEGCHDDDDNSNFKLPSSFPNDPSKKIRDGYLVLSPKEMASIFTPTFNEILDMIIAQILSAENTSKQKVTGVLLIGGFGESSYLHWYLSQRLKEFLGRDLEVLQPTNAWQAIVRGAVHDGIVLHKGGGSPDEGMLRSRRARFSYGETVCAPFQYGFHPIENKYVDRESGRVMCRGLMEWYIKQNDKLLVGASKRFPRRTNFEEDYNDDDLKFRNAVFFCDSEDPPVMLEDPSVRGLLRFEIDFTNHKRYIKTGRHVQTHACYKYIEFESILTYDGSARLEFSVEVDGEKVGSARVEYTHEVSSHSDRRITLARIINECAMQ